jgi:16S rRNA (cytosine967-C5)-methyltransferase
MRLPGRLAAAIEILADIDSRHRPASEALKDWGLSHRFAGSGDRAAIGNLVFDGLRKRLSHAARIGGEAPRAIALSVLRFDWGLSAEEIASLCDPAVHGPSPLTDAERAGLAREAFEGPDWVRADVPEWLWPEFVRAFGPDAVGEGQALAARAPVDLRVNTLKASREKALKALEAYGPQEMPFAPSGLRIAAPAGPQRAPHVEADAAFLKGWIEVQDESSQIAVALAGGEPGMQIADVCAGGGGKTLALAALMENKGQIHAYDRDKHRLAPIYDRLKRAGVRNVQVHAPGASLEALQGKMDLVFVDAPCTGTGVWRRRPDAKWRLRPGALEQRKKDQAEALDLGASLVKPGGRLVYATCSVLPAENGDQIAAFLARRAGWTPIDPETLALEGLGDEIGRGLLAAVRRFEHGVLLSPGKTRTDGFFVAGLRIH